jgi:hypothetical protein
MRYSGRTLLAGARHTRIVHRSPRGATPALLASGFSLTFALCAAHEGAAATGGGGGPLGLPLLGDPGPPDHRTTSSPGDRRTEGVVTLGIRGYFP